MGSSDGRGRVDSPVVAYTDFTCPYSYMAEWAVLDPLQQELGVAVEWRAYELWPPPLPMPPPGSRTELQRWYELVLPLAGELGIEIRPPATSPRTRKAHEASSFAALHGKQGPFRRAVFRAHFIEGRDIGRVDVLVELGALVGLDPTALKVALDIDQLTEQVLREEASARDRGITGVPALIVGEETFIGLHPYAEVRRLIARK